MSDTAILFDLDGTLWDSTEIICEIWNAVITQETGTPSRLTREHLLPLMGKTMEDIAAALFPGETKAGQARLIGLCGEAENEVLSRQGAVLYDGLEETLRALSADHRLLIVSNCQDGYIQAFFKAHELEAYFSDFESGRTGMPKWDNIRLIMERNGIKKAVYVGDTDGDQKAARLAGIPFVFAAYGFGSVSDPDGIIHNIKELPTCLRQLINMENEVSV